MSKMSNEFIKHSESGKLLADKEAELSALKAENAELKEANGILSDSIIELQKNDKKQVAEIASLKKDRLSLLSEEEV
jgi:uncharacterized protein YdcH (DUF465 family)